jgi:hypothetical protein
MEFIMKKLSRRLLFLLVVSVFLYCASDSFCSVVDWVGDGDGVNWSDIDNWADYNNGDPIWPFRLPNETDRVMINKPGAAVEINDGFAALANGLEVSIGSSPTTLKVINGSVTTAGEMKLTSNADFNGHGIVYVESQGYIDCNNHMYIGRAAKGEMFVNGGTVDVAAQTWLGRDDPEDSEGLLVIDGGTFNSKSMNVAGSADGTGKTSTIVIKNGGVLNLNINSDNTYPMNLGGKGRGEMYIQSGGTFNCPPSSGGGGGIVLIGWIDDDDVPLNPNRFGYIEIEEGTMYAQDIWVRYNSPDSGQINILWGQLILAGDKTSTGTGRIPTLVSAGIIVADGGDGTVEFEYDADMDQTVVTASNVRPKADVTGDYIVDINDMMIVANDWLK